MFERLSEKLESVFKKLRGHGSLSPELIVVETNENDNFAEVEFWVK